MNLASSVPEKNRGAKKANNKPFLRLVGNETAINQPLKSARSGPRRMPSPFQNRALAPIESEDISLPDLESCVKMWLRVSERDDTPKTQRDKRIKVEQFLWFLRSRNYTIVGTYEVEEFLKHVKMGHEEAAGRWGNPDNRKPMRPVTVRGYYNNVRALFNFIVARQFLGTSPVAVLKPTKVPKDRLYLFTEDEIRLLIDGALSTWHPRRNHAMLYLLYDTGLRVGELVALDRRHLDTRNQRLTVLGKGDKTRILRVGDAAFKAVWDYLREDPPGQADPLFRISRGKTNGKRLTERAVGFVITKLGRQVGIDGTRCSPHTMRHTFAVLYLDGGGNALDLMRLLGHTRLTMTSRYVALTNTRLAKQRQLDPGDKISDRK